METTSKPKTPAVVTECNGAEASCKVCKRACGVCRSRGAPDHLPALDTLDASPALHVCPPADLGADSTARFGRGDEEPSCKTCKMVAGMCRQRGAPGHLAALIDLPFGRVAVAIGSRVRVQFIDEAYDGTVVKRTPPSFDVKFDVDGKTFSVTPGEHAYERIVEEGDGQEDDEDHEDEEDEDGDDSSDDDEPGPRPRRVAAAPTRFLNEAARIPTSFNHRQLAEERKREEEAAAVAALRSTRTRPKAPVLPEEALPTREHTRPAKRQAASGPEPQKGVLPDDREKVARENEALVARRKAAGETSSPCAGVRWSTGDRKWRVCIRADGRDLQIGMFDNEETAARAYDKVARRIRGSEAHGGRFSLNFPTGEEQQQAEAQARHDEEDEDEDEEPFAVGDRVWVEFSGPRGGVYHARVAEVHSGGASYTLDWTNGEQTQRRQPASRVERAA